MGPGGDQAMGGPGDDRIRGGAGDDSANGERGADRLAGGPGNDTLLGWAGNDRLWGGTGDDALTGDANSAGDRFSRDRLRDGEQDIVACGPGFDVALLDFEDRIEGATPAAPDGDCERVRRAVPRPGDDRREGDG